MKFVINFIFHFLQVKNHDILNVIDIFKISFDLKIDKQDQKV